MTNPFDPSTNSIAPYYIHLSAIVARSNGLDNLPCVAHFADPVEKHLYMAGQGSYAVTEEGF